MLSKVLRFIEDAILVCGALIGTLLTLCVIVYFSKGIFQPYPPLPHVPSLTQKLIGMFFTGIVFLVPVGGAFTCIIALYKQEARWPALAAIPAALLGASIMFIFVGVGWRYHPEQNKLIGILLILGSGVISMAPFIGITIARFRRTSP